MVPRHWFVTVLICAAIFFAAAAAGTGDFYIQQVLDEFGPTQTDSDPIFKEMVLYALAVAVLAAAFFLQTSWFQGFEEWLRNRQDSKYRRRHHRRFGR